MSFLHSAFVPFTSVCFRFRYFDSASEPLFPVWFVDSASSRCSRFGSSIPLRGRCSRFGSSIPLRDRCSRFGSSIPLRGRCSRFGSSIPLRGRCSRFGSSIPLRDRCSRFGSSIPLRSRCSRFRLIQIRDYLIAAVFAVLVNRFRKFSSL